MPRRAGRLGRGSPIGRYLVLSLIGKGGMGNVYSAYDAELDRRIALKLLHLARGSEGPAGSWPARRARWASSRTPTWCRCYDVGDHRGDVFVAMELVEGEALDGWCRRSPKPGWQEVLGAYLDAARGLSAAHEKGLVHRDVKPSNILRGEDGRVCVADFGLAAGRDAERRPAGPLPQASSFGETMPAPAGLVGVVRRAADRDGRAAGDAALHGAGAARGVAGDRRLGSVQPLRGPLRGAVRRAAFHRDRERRLTSQAGRSPPRRRSAGPPRRAARRISPVPAWIHERLSRGLAPRPEDRYPSMDALADALGDPDARRRARRRRAGLGGAAAALLAVAAAGWWQSGAFQSPCAHPERQLAGVWDADLEARVRAAFLGTGRPYAGDTAARVAALLDRYRADWAAMRGEVCEASRGGRQRREILGLRDQCLDRRLSQLQALTTLFAEKPDPEILDKAVAATAGLTPIASCADTEALTARARPPEDPALRARVAALQPRADRLETLCTTGKYQEGLALGETLLAETAAIPYPPLRAQVQYYMGQFRLAAGDYPQAKALLEDAALSAAEGKDDILAATAWSTLLFVVGDRQQRFEEASVIRSLGRGALARVQDDRTQAAWLNIEGSIVDDMGRYAEARVLLERAVGLKEKALGPGDPSVANTLSNLGVLLYDVGDFPGALATHERALALRERVLGPDHPDVAESLNNLANALFAMGVYERSKAIEEQVLSAFEKSLGPDHPYVGNSFINLGSTCSSSMGELPAGLGLGYEQALDPPREDPRPRPPRRRLRPRRQGPHPGGPRPDRRRPSPARGARAPCSTRPRATLSPRPRRAAPRPRRAEPRAPPAGAGPAPAGARPRARRGRAHARDPAHPGRSALASRPRPRSRARALAEQAHASYEHIGHAPGLDRATRWLAAHPAP